MLRLTTRALFSSASKSALPPPPSSAAGAMSSFLMDSTSIAAKPAQQQVALAHNLSVSQQKNACPLPAAWSRDDAGKFNINASYAFLFQKENQTKSLKFLTKQQQQEQTNAAVQVEESAGSSSIEAMNRNARRPKKANKGARPCSHVARRARRIRRHSGW